MNTKQEQKGSSGTSQKWISVLVEKNATGFIVAIILIVLIICFTVLAANDKLKDNVVTLFSSAIVGLIGFFAGSKAK